MIYIAHRGNVSGSNPELENSPEYVDEAISNGYFVEIDVRKGSAPDEFFAGHDYGKYKLSIDWFKERRGRLFIHAKDIETYTYFISRHDWNVFWHQNDAYTLTSAGFIWALPGSKLNEKTICVMPENVLYSKEDISCCAGICSDHVAFYRDRRHT